MQTQSQLQPKPMPHIKLETQLVYRSGEEFINPVIPGVRSQWRENSYLGNKSKGNDSKVKDKPKDSIFRKILDGLVRKWETAVLVVAAAYVMAQVIRVWV